MHHVPSGPSPADRIRAVFSFRTRRVVPALLVGMVAGMIAVIALAVPALSGSSAPVSLDSSSSNSANGDSPVVLGEDGRPVPRPPTARQHRTAPSSTAAGHRTGAVSGAPTGTQPPAVAGTSGRLTLPGSTGPAGTTSASSSGSSSAPGSSSSSAPSSSSSAPPSSPSAPPPPPPSGDTVLTLVNDARANAGCAALTADAALADAALTNSTDMAAQGAPAVVDPAGTAAVVATGQPDADSVVTAWLADPTDKATLLDCGLTSAGLGKLHAGGDVWWTLFLS